MKVKSESEVAQSCQHHYTYLFQRILGGSDGKESACDVADRFDPWVGKISWRRERLLTLAFLPGKFHGQRSLVGYGPWDHKKLDMTVRLTLSYIFILALNTLY